MTFSFAALSARLCTFANVALRVNLQIRRQRPSSVTSDPPPSPTKDSKERKQSTIIREATSEQGWLKGRDKENESETKEWREGGGALGGGRGLLLDSGRNDQQVWLSFERL